MSLIFKYGLEINPKVKFALNSLRGGVTQWVARLTRNVEVVGSSLLFP